MLGGAPGSSQDLDRMSLRMSCGTQRPPGCCNAEFRFMTWLAYSVALRRLFGGPTVITPKTICELRWLPSRGGNETAMKPVNKRGQIRPNATLTH